MNEAKSLVSKPKSKKDKEVRTTVEEIENGFLIVRESNWQDVKTGYQYETKKYFSKVNPLVDTEKKLSESFEE
jgi:hypothetical protein